MTSPDPLKDTKPPEPTEPPKPSGVLWKRVLSSMLLIPPPIIATWFGGPAFAILISLAAAAMVFEWSRMVTGKNTSPVLYSLAAGGAAAMIFAVGGWFGVAIAFSIAASIAAAIAARLTASRVMSGAFGAIYILIPCIALIWLRNDVENGRELVFSLFGIVWMADIGAYAAGRFFGGPRISRALSPAKTWSGVVGGIAMGGVAGAIALRWIYGDGAAQMYAGIGAGLGLASVLGDLAESALKRNFGVKDSSSLIPGHGGVLDRLDGMIFATSAMTLAIFLHMMIARG